VRQIGHVFMASPATYGVMEDGNEWLLSICPVAVRRRPLSLTWPLHSCTSLVKGTEHFGSNASPTVPLPPSPHLGTARNNLGLLTEDIQHAAIADTAACCCTELCHAS